MNLYSMSVREHVMIAHSFVGEVFGPAQRLHGATYVVDATFFRASLDEHGIVADIGLALQSLKDILTVLNFRNLDELEIFAGRNTTTEVVARWVFDEIAQRLRDGELGAAAREVCKLHIKLHESPLAWAAYEGDPRRAITATGDRPAA